MPGRLLPGYSSEVALPLKSSIALHGQVKSIPWGYTSEPFAVWVLVMLFKVDCLPSREQALPDPILMPSHLLSQSEPPKEGDQ